MLQRCHSFFKELSLLALLFCVVLLVNAPVISFDMMYPEQATLYLANQSINHTSDLLRLYLHPQWLHAVIPFFRPSGHFLLYQLLAPLLGWHNTKGFLIVNFIFLGLTGYAIIKFYSLLFPRYQAGGYVAFSIYLMHPILSLPRFTIMHFEFAYVFFCLASLCCFVKALPKNHVLLFLSLLCYVIAVTFKEPALMLGPALLLYYFMYAKPKPMLVLLLIIVTITLGLYITLPWPTMTHPTRPININNSLASLNEFLKDLFAVPHDVITRGNLPFPNSAWRQIVFPAETRYLLWSLTGITIVGLGLLLKRHSSLAFHYKKSLSFLLLTGLLFLLLPLIWAMGAPWHLSLTLVCLSLIMGFCVDYSCHALYHSPLVTRAGVLMFAFAIALTTTTVNNHNILRYVLDPHGAYFILSVNRNAVMFPPNIQAALTPESIIVVEDAIIHYDYILGNSAYPLLLFVDKTHYDALKQPLYFVPFDPHYNGSLFKWAYLMPTLKEEVYPFSVENMEDIPNEMIYHWLRHQKNIFCLGYDRQANWHDRTARFQQQLLTEQQHRQLQIHPYQVSAKQSLSGSSYFSKILPFPDPELCQFTCDQATQCKGFTYLNSECIFLNALATTPKPCPTCTAYKKYFS